MNARTFLLTCWFALAFPSHASVIENAEGSPDLLIVEYTGTVLDVEGPGYDYEEFDPISGRLRIDLALAPPDRQPAVTIGDYHWDAPGKSGFVSAGGVPDGSVSRDFVWVGDDMITDPNDPEWYRWWHGEYFVNDHEIYSNGDSNLISLGAVFPRGAIHGDGLVQPLYNADASNSYDRGPSALEKVIGGVRSRVEFALDRFSVRPLVCTP